MFQLAPRILPRRAFCHVTGKAPSPAALQRVIASRFSTLDFSSSLLGSRRYFAKTQSSAATSRLAGLRSRVGALFTARNLGYFVAGNCVLQLLYGSGDDIILDTFRTWKNPDALAEFYEAHDLLEVMMPLPPLFKFVLDQVAWLQAEEPYYLGEDESVCYVGLVGMDVAFIITREEEEGTGPDGDDKLVKFVRHERFVHNIPLLADYVKIPVCESTWKFGFRKLDKRERDVYGEKQDREARGAGDGEDQYEVFHECVNYTGFWLFRLGMWAHTRYVAWGCEKIVNNSCFGDQEDESKEEEHRRQVACVPWYEVKRALYGSA